MIRSALMTPAAALSGAGSENAAAPPGRSTAAGFVPIELPAPRAPVDWTRIFAVFRAPERELERLWRRLHAAGVWPAEELFYCSESSTPGLFTLMGWMRVPSRQVPLWRGHPRRLVWHEASTSSSPASAAQAQRETKTTSLGPAA